MKIVERWRVRLGMVSCIGILTAAAPASALGVFTFEPAATSLAAGTPSVAVELWLAPDGSGGVEGVQLGFAVSGAVVGVSLEPSSDLGGAFDPLDSSFDALSALLGGSDPGIDLAFVLLAATPAGSPIEGDAPVLVATLTVALSTPGAPGEVGRLDLMSIQGWAGAPLVPAGAAPLPSNVGCALGDVPGFGSGLCVAPISGNPAVEVELVPEPAAAGLLGLVMLAAFTRRAGRDS
ncbi:MAG: PEP-CTERM sorting domain-containing protein [Myxococcales bacterium]|nr:PEP-CTERM sorting domain-containing protein [Myxococcales bacterium]